MTSADSAQGGGEGSPKKQTKGPRSTDFCMRQGGEGAKNQNILRTSYKYHPRRPTRYMGGRAIGHAA